MALSPERAVAIQEALGSDVAMVLDHVVGLPNAREVDPRRRRAHGPLGRALPRRRHAADQALFAIVQGGLDPDLRVACARQLRELDFPGYAIGGLSVGESRPRCTAMLDATVPELPADRPRYLMGVGRPEDLLEAIRRGIDLFDCVMPTRNGRNAMAFTDAGPLRLRNLQYERDDAAARRGLPLRRLPPQPRLHPPPVHGRRDARADPAVAPQPDLLPAAAGRRPGGHCGRPLYGVRRREAGRVGRGGEEDFRFQISDFRLKTRGRLQRVVPFIRYNRSEISNPKSAI